MIRQLILKELRGLKPWVGLAVLLSLFGLVLTFATEFPDGQIFDPTKFLGEELESVVIIMLLITLLASAGLLVNEDENRTLLFLDGLPLTRTRVFLGKWFAALIILAGILLFEIVQLAALGLISRDSVSEPFPWKFLIVETLLLYAVMVFGLGVFLLMSFLRRWLALGLGLLVWLYLMAQLESESIAGWLDPMQLVRPSLENGRITVPWRHLAAQLTVSAICTALAWICFVRMGARFAQTRSGFARSAGVFVLRASIPAVWIAVIVTGTKDMVHDDLDERPGREESFTRKRTDHYEFLFRESQQDAAAPLIAAADGVFREVSQFFGAPELTGRVVADLASPIIQHASGQAHWKKVRMTVEPGDTLDDLKAVLGHETAHVMIDLASNSSASDHFAWSRWFHEGLASYVEINLLGGISSKDEMERVCAHAASRGSIRFEQLVSDAEFSKERDLNLVYPLGWLWCEALVEVYGRDAPAKVCRALDAPSVRAIDQPVEFWRATLQKAGYDLERVNGAFDTHLSRVGEKHAEWVKSIPEISATVEFSGSDIVLSTTSATNEFTASAMLIARVLDRSPDGVMDLNYLVADSHGKFTVKRGALPGPRIWYQVGWLVTGDGEGRFGLFEKWRQATPGQRSEEPKQSPQ